APPGLLLPRPPRGRQRGPLGRGPGAQAADGHRAEAAAWPPRHERGAARRPAQEADRGQGRGAVRAPPPVRAAAARPRRAEAVAADPPWAATTPHVARADGGCLPAVRPAVSDGHRAGQARGPAGAAAAVRPAPRGAEEAAVAGPGEGTGVPGRAAAGCDIERRGAREPAISQDAEDRVPGAHEAGDRGPTGV